METSLFITVIFTLIWTGACGVAISRLLARRKNGPLHHDQFLTLVAIVSLAAAPWISLIVYFAGGRETLLGGSVNVIVAAAVFLAAWRARGARLNPGAGSVSTTSFRQQSAVLMLATLAVTYVSYAVLTWQMPSLIIPLFFGSALLITLVAIVGHGVIALAYMPAEELNDAADERDRAAERHGMGKAYGVLACGIWLLPVMALLDLPALVVTNGAFLIIVLAQGVKYAGMVSFYRHGDAQ